MRIKQILVAFLFATLVISCGNKAKNIDVKKVDKQTIMSDISSRVKAIIVDKLGVDDNEVTTEASFTNDLGADSLDTVELIMEFEEEFDIQIPDDQAENIGTLGQAVRYIEAAKDINVSERKTEFSEEFKDEFTRECVKNAKVYSSTSKAERYCSCMLDKVMTKYDSELDAENMTVNDVLELAESCNN